MRNHSARFSFDRLVALYIWIAFLLVFGIWKPDTFLTAATLHSVASQQAVTAMLAIAVAIPLAAGAYDLSVGATANLATVIAVWLQSAMDVPMFAAIATAIATAVVIGTVNGIVVVKLKVHSFIATLGMATIVSAIQTIVVGPTQPYPPTTPEWPMLTATTIGGFQLIVVYLLVIAFAMWWMLTKTATGRYIYASGGNPEAARLAGAPVGRSVFVSLLLASTTAGIGGVLYGSLYGPSLTYGSSLLLPAFAAAFLGSVLQRGRINVWGTVAAVYILATGVQGLQLATSAQWISEMFNGVVLILVVGFATWRRRVTARAKALEKAEQTKRREPPAVTTSLQSPISAGERVQAD